VPKNPVSYAEDDLGVHVVWDEARARLDEHETAKARYLAALKSLRITERQITDRNMELVTEQRGLQPELKVTAFREHMKVVAAEDDTMVGLQSQLEDDKTERDEAKADMEHHELGLRALTARMHELAGLLEFYATAKSAQTAQKGAA
jgi:hypothetical protein